MNHPNLSPTMAEREKMIADQLPQVRYIARRIHERLPKHVEFDDLVHAGVIGLMDAANKFDFQKNVKFRSYAQFRIRGAILDSLRELDWSPRDLRRKARQIESVIQKLSATLGRAPEDHEIAAEMEIPLAEFHSTVGDLRGLEVGTLTVENDSETGSENDRTLSLAADPGEDPYHRCLESEMRSLLGECIRELGTKEQQVLSLYYFEELSMRQIGTVLGVGESRVSQIHSAAVLKLRTLMRARSDRSARPSHMQPRKTEGAAHLV